MNSAFSTVHIYTVPLHGRCTAHRYGALSYSPVLGCPFPIKRPCYVVTCSRQVTACQSRKKWPEHCTYWNPGTKKTSNSKRPGFVVRCCWKQRQQQAQGIADACLSSVKKKTNAYIKMAFFCCWAEIFVFCVAYKSLYFWTKFYRFLVNTYKFSHIFFIFLKLLNMVFYFFSKYRPPWSPSITSRWFRLPILLRTRTIRG